MNFCTGTARRCAFPGRAARRIRGDHEKLTAAEIERAVDSIGDIAPLLARSWRRAATAGLAALALTGAARVAGAAPYFQEVLTPYGVQGCSGAKEGCWTNYMRMTDIDGDGDLDLLFPSADGFFVKGAAQPFSVYLNDGTGVFTSGAAQIVNGYPGYVRQVATGDVDGDGDVDLERWGEMSLDRANRFTSPIP